MSALTPHIRVLRELAKAYKEGAQKDFNDSQAEVAKGDLKTGEAHAMLASIQLRHADAHLLAADRLEEHEKAREDKLYCGDHLERRGDRNEVVRG